MDRNNGQAQAAMTAKQGLFVGASIIFGPLFLIYLTLRCERNLCVLFQLPLVIPTHVHFYFSTLSFLVVLTFMVSMFLLSAASRANWIVPAGLVAFLSSGLILAALAFVKPDCVRALHQEYLKLLVATTCTVLVLSCVLQVLASLDILRDPDYVEPNYLATFFYGNNKSVLLGHVELKYFFYVHVGIVAWGLLDLVILFNAWIEGRTTWGLTFLTVSQLMVICYTLINEKYLKAAPFVRSERLGYFWLMRVLMYQPFLNSLLCYNAATTETMIYAPFFYTVAVFFIVGFFIYSTALLQLNAWKQDPKHAQFKHYRTYAGHNGKKLLGGGYWGIVQKPDYMGYIIMAISWTLACGFNALSVCVFLVMMGSIAMFLSLSSSYKRREFGNTVWQKYTASVPYQIIPRVY